MLSKKFNVMFFSIYLFSVVFLDNLLWLYSVLIHCVYCSCVVRPQITKLDFDGKYFIVHVMPTEVGLCV